MDLTRRLDEHRTAERPRSLCESGDCLMSDTVFTLRSSEDVDNSAEKSTDSDRDDNVERNKRRRWTVNDPCGAHPLVDHSAGVFLLPTSDELDDRCIETSDRHVGLSAYTSFASNSLYGKVQHESAVYLLFE
uniref:Uncharacterized protein n=1 Tax=Trichuris muris TaxID=70415 RepID=A0A5S6QCG9_TRIMR